MSTFKQLFFSFLISHFSFLIFSASPVYAIQTALGPISTDPGGLAKDILDIAIKVAGGIAFLLMLYGGFLFLTSSGDQQKLQEATDVITSALAGLLMIVFSVFLLELIGVKILGL